MRIKINTSVSIKHRGSGIESGTVHWIDDDQLMISSPGHLDPHTPCELKIELTRTGEQIYTEAQVLRATSYQTGRGSRAICRMVKLSSQDQKRLERFLNTQRERPNSRAGITRGIAVSGRTPLPSADQTIPLRDPMFALSEDGRRVTVRWYNGKSYRRDWALHLSNGLLPISCTPPGRSAFMLRLVLPDGFVATFPAEISNQAASGWHARFLIPFGIRHRMQTSAQLAGHRAAE